MENADDFDSRVTDHSGLFRDPDRGRHRFRLFAIDEFVTVSANLENVTGVTEWDVDWSLIIMRSATPKRK
ncbi:hypothetical protein [Pseudomonas citri]|uniref:hypothetical protein n=1 Tax=Pseudomonas citri TaxID=2978349 RepID=UPI0021B637FF|nr:hypothetical protein [Pseudomonas citri]